MTRARFADPQTSDSFVPRTCLKIMTWRWTKSMTILSQLYSENYYALIVSILKGVTSEQAFITMREGSSAENVVSQTMKFAKWLVYAKVVKYLNTSVHCLISTQAWCVRPFGDIISVWKRKRPAAEATSQAAYAVHFFLISRYNGETVCKVTF